MDEERPALDGKAGVIGLRGDHAGLDRKTRAPERVRLSIRGCVDGVRRGGGGRPRFRESEGPRLKG